MSGAAEKRVVVSDLLRKRREQMFPKLGAAQIARLETHGQRIEIRPGEVLAEPGNRQLRVFVVLSGSIEDTPAR